MPDSIIEQIQSQIPITKLRPPRTQETIVRESLLSQLRDALSLRRLLLLSAPAGSGKTTLAADFVHSAEAFTIFWLTLDVGDNDTTTFMLAFAVALGLQPDAGVLESINQGHMVSRHVANVLINLLDAHKEQPFVLVLDDLHLVTNPEIYEFLDYFIDHVPAHGHLLITTRYDPPLSLAKWRARGELIEIRLDDLRFQRAEVSVLLNQVLQLNIPDELIGQMVDRTEGWIAGLRLLALSLERVDVAQRGQYITNLAERDRYVFDLLAEEVLSQQSDAMQAFLLQTAILDELTPELCIAITQQADAAEKLRELHRHNLFLVSVGDGTYRYHALFQDFLQTFLKHDQPTLLKALHRRAADAHSIPYRKIHHYLAAEAWEPAIVLISQYGRRLIEHSNRSIVQDWLSRLPEAVLDQAGWLIYLQGVLAYHRGDFEMATCLFEQAEGQFQKESEREGCFESVLMQSACDFEEDNFEKQLDYVRRMDAYMTNDAQRVQRELFLGWVYLYFGRRSESAQHFCNTLDHLMVAPQKAGFVGFQIASPICIVFDNLSQIRSRLQRVLRKLGQGDHIFAASTHSILATIALWQGDMTQAETELETSLSIWKRLGGVNVMNQNIVKTIQLVLASLLNDDATIEVMTQPYRDQPQAHMNVALIRARRAWLKGDKVETRYILNHMPPMSELESSNLGSAYRICIESLCALDDGTFHQVEPQLLHYVHRQRDERSFYSLYLLDLRVTLAYCYLNVGLHNEALDVIRALMNDYAPQVVPGRLAQEGEYIVPLMELAIAHHIYPQFAMSVLALLRSIHEPRPLHIPETGETLTAREAEILHLLVEGSSNQQIADTCVISIPTVKTHVSRILQKLAVSSRTQAVAKAHELRLL